MSNQSHRTRNDLLLSLVLMIVATSGCQDADNNVISCYGPSPTSIDELAPHASGVSLAEVVAIKEVDERPSDGSLYLNIELRTIESSGITLDELQLFLEHGGHSPAPMPETPVEATVPADTFQVGQQLWLAFYVSGNDLGATGRNPEWLLGAWSVDDMQAAPAFRAAIDNDEFRWKPQFDPETELSLGHVIDQPGDHFTIRVTEGQEELWRKKIQGTKSERYASWGMWNTLQGAIPISSRYAGKLVIVESAQSLAAGNEYGLVPGTYYVKYAFDPETGDRRAVAISRHQAGQVDLVSREYTEQGALSRETRFELDSEPWIKLENTFDENGERTDSKRFQFDAASGKYLPTQ